ALLFILVLALLSPALALTCTLLIAALCAVILIGQRSIREPTAELSTLSAQSGSMTNFMAVSGETVRAFNCQTHLQNQWREATGAVARVRQWLHARQTMVQQIGQSGATALNVAIFAVGSRAVVQGHLDVGSLIGASILGSRALAAVTRVAHLSEGFERARQSLQQLTQLAELPMEKRDGVAPLELTGQLEIADMAFGYP